MSRLDVSQLIQMVATVLGGLGLFLLGMKNMSEGMQAVAGNSLRRMIGAVTNNRLLATAVGVGVTCVVQSSTVTTVMVIGFVNSGAMQLAQAVGVIMGANIGTTITGWILVLRVGIYGLPLLGAAALVHLFARRERWKFWALAFMGVGMIFFGLELMKEGAALVKELPDFEAWFQRFQADTYPGVLLCALVGCVLTVLVQSSSATLGITISLAFQGVISYETAAALILGENLGTTITAYLASLGATTVARRAAYFHVIFNLTGVFWITLIFPWYIELIQWIVGGNVGLAATTAAGVTVYPRTTAAIAATHTVFNLVNTLAFLPFLPFFVRLLERVVPAKTYKEKPHLTDLDFRMLETPLLAIEQSRKELFKMGDGCRKMMEWLRTILVQDDPDRSLAERIRRREQVLDAIDEEMAVFVTRLLSGSLSQAIAEEARTQLRMAHEYEAISDYLVNLLKFDQRLRKEGMRFPEKQLGDLLTLHNMVAEYLRVVDEAHVQQNRNILTVLAPARKATRRLIKRLRREHLEDLSREEIAPQVSVAFMAALNAYTRVRDHSLNVAEAVAGRK